MNLPARRSSDLKQPVSRGRTLWSMMRALLFIGCALLLLAAAGLFIVTQPLVRALPSQPPAVDPQRLRAHVRHLSVELYPRSHEQLQNLERAAAYIRNAFAASGGKLTAQEFSVQGRRYQNLVLRFGPASGPLLVIGAHYDSHGDAPAGERGARKFSADTHTPGADDNASGVAGLLELAALLGRKPPPRPVELVAYTLEEPPYFRSEDMGSAWHARSMRMAHRQVSLMLSLEMIGSFSDAPGSQDYPVAAMSKLYSDRGNFIGLVGKLSDFGAMRRTKAAMAGATDLPVLSINAPPQLQGLDFSDHLSYWNQGYPALMVTDTAFMRNKQYHLGGDTWDKLDYRRMAQVVQGVYAVAQQPR
jgi:Zn-dependent M28 family amino/carboxypeptidase